MKTKTLHRTRKLTLTALFVCLIIVGAFLKIPFVPVAFSLQTFFVMAAGLYLGWAWGCAAVTVYIAIGFAGLPVFSAGGGIGYVATPTFGYLLGMYPLVAACGLFRKKRFPIAFAAVYAAAVICLGVGTLYAFGYYSLQGEVPSTLFTGFFVWFLAPELLKAALACALFRATKKPLARYID